MKTLKIDVRQVLILMASLAFFSCSKDPEVGPAGPQGSQGEQGIQGPEGPQGLSGQDGADGQDGQDGADGEDGNANVIVSDWIATDFTTNATSFTFFEVDALGTNTNGAFLVYGKRIEVADGGGEFIYQMPHVRFNERYSYLIEPGEVDFPNVIPNKIRFTARSVDGTDETFSYFEEVRYVNIPQSTSGKLAIDFNKMTYEEVMDHFGLSY